MKPPASKTGWAFAALYLAAFVAEYADYLANKGTWFADLGLNVLALPYIFVGRGLTMDRTFELHGFQVWGLVPAALFCAALAYFIGYGLEKLVRRAYRLYSRR